TVFGAFTLLRSTLGAAPPRSLAWPGVTEPFFHVPNEANGRSNSARKYSRYRWSTPQNRPLVTQPAIQSRPMVVSASSAPAIDPEVLTSIVCAPPAGKLNRPMPVRWVTERSTRVPEAIVTPYQPCPT